MHAYNYAELEKSIATSFQSFDENGPTGLVPIIQDLFAFVRKDLEQAIIGNPMHHHIIVLENMMEIALKESFSLEQIKRAAAISILHDISPVEKITTQQVNDRRKNAPEEADVLELRRQQNRILHMREGSALAHRRMLEFNESQRKIVFNAQDIEVICETIRIHDNPSINIPIPRCNWIAVSFREADRLWMLTHEGICADLVRKERDIQDSVAYQKQLESNIERFKAERRLYTESTEGPFCDNETFFRTKAGYEIYQRYQVQNSQRHRYKQQISL